MVSTISFCFVLRVEANMYCCKQTLVTLHSELADVLLDLVQLVGLVLV